MSNIRCKLLNECDLCLSEEPDEECLCSRVSVVGIAQFFLRFLPKTALLLLVFYASSLCAQEGCVWDPALIHNVRPRVEVRPATCLDNGSFIYWLDDVNGNVVKKLDERLSDVRLFYHRLNENEIIYSDFYVGGKIDTVFDLQAGVYVVGVEGSLDNGSGYTSMCFVDTMTIESLYTLPAGSILQTTATTLAGYGTHPTLSCYNTGLVQFMIENGRFPYYIETHDEQGHVVRIDTFYSNMYTGEDENKYNYKDYYTIDSLSAGQWSFYFRDACSYGFSLSSEIIEEVSLPLVDRIDVYASSGNTTYNRLDSNIVKVRAHISYPYEYYIRAFDDFMSYRIIKGSSSGNDEQWHPFPSLTSSVTILYDTLSGVHRYCDLYQDSIRFQFHIKVEGCEDTVVNHVFHYSKPNESKFSTNKLETSIGLKRVLDSPNPCDYVYFKYTEANRIHYNSYRPDNANANEDHNEYRYHYTGPLTWIYLNQEVENDTLKIDTIQTIDTYSTFTLEDAGIDLSYFDSHSDPFVKSVDISLMDAHGCELYRGRHRFEYKKEETTEQPRFEVAYSSSDHCCEVEREIYVRTAGVLADSVLIDSIKLISSPKGNRYNFVATFNSSILTWLMVPMSTDIQNVLAVNELNYVGSPFGREFTVKGYCLPAGKYKFEIITACGSNIIERNIGFQDVHIITLKEEPEYMREQICSELYLTYTKGQFQLERSDANTTTISDFDTRFRVISGPAGGYNTRLYEKNERIRLTLPGTYVLEMLPNGSTCESNLSVYDTIEYIGTFVDLDYASALRCKEEDLGGDVYVGALDGNTPYIYTLYDTINLIGNLIAKVKVWPNGTHEIIENPGNVAIDQRGVGLIFKDIPMRNGKQLSCMIEDSCGAYFSINFFPQTLATMNKVWFDNNQREAVICEGDSVQVHALKYGSFFSYTWAFRDIDETDTVHFSTVPDPFLTLPRGSQEGMYYVEIAEHGCANMDVVDSIHLKIKQAPSINMHLEMYSDISVCPGDTVLIIVTPHSPMGSDSVSFSLAFANELGVETRDYKGKKDEVMEIKYEVLYSTHIYSVHIEDEECSFNHPEDSLLIETKSGEMFNNCNLLTRGDTVCENSSADLYARASIDMHTYHSYTLQWYHDFAMTSLAQEDIIYSDEDWSHYHTANLMQDTALYLRVLAGETCSSHHAISTETVTFADSVEHIMDCSDVVRLYDSGGRDGNYGKNEEWEMHFVADRPLTIHFEELDLATTSTLFVFSGPWADMDSLLYQLNYNSVVPDIIVTKGNTLTLFFLSKANTARGWNALVQTVGSVAIAEVRKPIVTELMHEVCQTQTGLYDDIYHVVGEIVPDNDTINKMIKQAGVYQFFKTYPRPAPLCDSMVTFLLTVHHPEYKTPTTVVTTTLESNYPYVWHGNTYYDTDQYYELINEGLCDIYDVLNLVVLEIDTITGQVDVCKGQNASLGVIVHAPDVPKIFTHINHVGDVLCTDNSILPPDSFLRSGKVAKGVVFYLDPYNNNKGKAIALRDAYEGYNGRGKKNQTQTYNPRLPGECIWAANYVTYKGVNHTNVHTNIYSRKIYNMNLEAIHDMDGKGNTDTIRKSTFNVVHIDTATATENDMRTAFELCAPAAYYCYYYNADSARAGKGERTGDNTGIAASGWYLPSLGEFGIYFANRLAVNRTLQMLQAPPHNARLMQGRIDYNIYYHDECYWTSTEGPYANHSCAYRMAGKGQLIAHKQEYHKAFTVNNPTFVRAIIDF